MLQVVEASDLNEEPAFPVPADYKERVMTPEVAEAVAVEAPKATPKPHKKAAPKTAGKAESNGHAPVKKTAKKAQAKKPAAKKDGPKELSAPQVRILKALARNSRPLKGTDLAEKAEVDPSAIGNQAGYRDPDINKRPVHKHNLLNRGLVKIEDAAKHDHEATGYVYVLTAKGRETAKKA